VRLAHPLLYNEDVEPENVLIQRLMKQEHQMSEHRVALFLSLAVASRQWQVASCVILPVQWQPRQLSSDILNGIASAATQWQSDGSGIVSKLNDTSSRPELSNDLPASLPLASTSVTGLPLASLPVLDAARLASAQQVECHPFQEGTNYHTNGIDVKHTSGLLDATSCSHYCHKDSSYFTFGTADPFTGMCWCKNDNRDQQVLKSVTSGTSCPAKNGTALLAHKFRGLPLPHPMSTEIIQLIQRKASRYFRRGEPQNIEDVNFILGVPKIVWVILATALAMGAWAGCIMSSLHCARLPDFEHARQMEIEEAARADNNKGSSAREPLPVYAPAYAPAYVDREPAHAPGPPPAWGSYSYSASQPPTFTRMDAPT